MQALLGDTVLAEADRDEMILIEGNWYFPPASVRTEHVVESPTPYACPLKGQCQYLTVVADDVELPDRAWNYPDPYPAAIERFGDFSGYVAFWKEVRVVDESGRGRRAAVRNRRSLAVSPSRGALSSRDGHEVNRTLGSAELTTRSSAR